MLVVGKEGALEGGVEGGGRGRMKLRHGWLERL